MLFRSPIALYLYSSVVSGGKGLSTAFCRWPALVSLGRYALYAYLFQMPYAEFIESTVVAALPSLWRCCRRTSGGELEKRLRK